MERETRNEARLRRGYVKIKCHPVLPDGIFCCRRVRLCEPVDGRMRPSLCERFLLGADSHAVEGTVNEEDRHREEGQRQNVGELGAVVSGERDG